MGFPVGLQVIGRAWDEAGILRIGRAYEAITADADWRTLEPSALPALEDAATAPPHLPDAASTSGRRDTGPAGEE